MSKKESRTINEDNWRSRAAAAESDYPSKTSSEERDDYDYNNKKDSLNDPSSTTTSNTTNSTTTNSNSTNSTETNAKTNKTTSESTTNNQTIGEKNNSRSEIYSRFRLNCVLKFFFLSKL